MRCLSVFVVALLIPATRSGQSLAQESSAKTRSDDARERKEADPDAIDAWRGMVATSYELMRLGRVDLAEGNFTLTLAMAERTLPADDPRLAESVRDLAWIKHKRGDLAAAEPFARRAVELHEKARPRDDFELARTLTNLAAILISQDRLDEAEVILRRALKLAEGALGQDHLRLAPFSRGLGEICASRKNFKEAEALIRRSLELTGKLPDGIEKDMESARCEESLGSVLEDQEREDEALTHYRNAVIHWESVYGKSHPEIVGPLTSLGLSESALGHRREAEATLQRAIKIADQYPGASKDGFSGLRKSYEQIKKLN